MGGSLTWFVNSSPVVVCDAGVLPLTCRCALVLIARRSRDGLAASPLLHQARILFYRARMSAQRHKGAAYHLAESRCNGQGRLANPKTQRRSRVAMQNRR